MTIAVKKACKVSHWFGAENHSGYVKLEYEQSNT